MARAVLPKKADSRLYKTVAEAWHDGAGFWFSVLVLSIIGLPVTLGLALDFALMWLLLLIPFTLYVAAGSRFLHNTLEITRYHSSIYERAYKTYNMIGHHDSKSDARVLLERIWEHQKALDFLKKDHNTKLDCPECNRRVELMVQLRDNQPVAGTDTSDIESIESKLAARKELGV